MKLSERISQDIAAAMKARDAARLSPLRMVKAAFMNAEAQQVLASLIKQRRDSIEQFTSGGRMDLVEKEKGEIAVLEQYAPPAASAEQIEQAVDAAIKETGASSAKDMGRVMKAVMSALAGSSVDGKVV